MPGLQEYAASYRKSEMRLLPGSAAIDQGITSAITPKVDIDGEVRPNPGGAIDIGHDELHP